MDWTTAIVAAFIATFLTAATSQLGSAFANWLLAPKLDLRFEHTAAGRLEVPTSAGEKTIHLRLTVKNTKRRIAKSCRGYLTNIEVLKDGAERRLWWDAFPLRWASLTGDPMSEKSVPKYEVDVPKDVEFKLDLFATVQDRSGIQLHGCVPNYFTPPEMGTFRLTVMVSANDADTVKQQFLLNLGSNYQDFGFEADRNPT